MNNVVVKSVYALSGGLKSELPAEIVPFLRRADELTKLAAQCTFSAVKLTNTSHDPDMIGIYSGLSFGPLETNFRFLDSLLDDGEGCASPTIFSHSVHNAMAGYLSRIFKITGPVLTFTSFTWPFLIALREAFWAIKSGSVTRALVTTAEIYSPPIGYAVNKLNQQYEHSLNSGAVCWILESESICSQQKNLILQEIQIEEYACDDSSLLLRKKERSDSIISPLWHALDLTDKITKSISEEKTKIFWESKAVFGQVNLQFLSKNEKEKSNEMY